MKHTTLGNTGISVSALGYGAMELRGPQVWNGRGIDLPHADRLLNSVLDSGINFIDTAPCYGISEETIGKCIAHRRSEYILATKCGGAITRHDKGEWDISHDFKEQTLRENIDASLKLLKTDYIDIWQLHNPKPDRISKDMIAAVIEDLKAQGKIRHGAISTTMPFIKTFIEWDFLEAFQMAYSGLERNEERIISDVAARGRGTIIRGGVAQGDAGRNSDEKWAYFEQSNIAELFDDGETPAGFLLRFVLTHPGAQTVIVGTSSTDHLKENVDAAQKGPLTEELYEECKRRLDSAGCTILWDAINGNPLR
ncbi:MAG: aldo/keto reductase [Chitinivibrionales bacterium]|nr:aldo/keto reductase [Chitinivibrionales bacterium]